MCSVCSSSSNNNITFNHHNKSSSNSRCSYKIRCNKKGSQNRDTRMTKTLRTLTVLVTRVSSQWTERNHLAVGPHGTFSQGNTPLRSQCHPTKQEPVRTVQLSMLVIEDFRQPDRLENLIELHVFVLTFGNRLWL